MTAGTTGVPGASGRPTTLDVALTVEQCWQPVPGGSGTYVVELTRALAARDDVRVLGLAARHAGPTPVDWRPGGRTAHSRLPRSVLYEAWNRWGHPRAEATVRAASDRPHVVHATTWAIPPTRRPLVVTVHDLAFLRSPEHFTPRGVRFFERALERTRAEADLVVVPSQVTADDCVAAGLDTGRVRVVPHGVRIGTPTDADVAAFRRTHSLPARYLLWCGTLEPRKNLSRLLDAFAVVAASDPGLHLLVVGPAGWGDAGLGGTTSGGTSDGTHGRPDQDRISGRVHVVGHLSWDDLQAAYAGATAFCFPSLWEGFGMPVSEAMAHGLPVVTSAGTAMAEVAGGAALLVDPLDVDAIARAVERAVGDDRTRLAAASTARAADLTWDRAAERTLAVYREAVGSHRRPRDGRPGTAG